MGVPGPTKNSQISFSENRLAGDKVSLKKSFFDGKGCGSMGKAYMGVFCVELSIDTGGNDERGARSCNVSSTA